MGGNVLYIVDYDLPVEVRYKFYRWVKRLLKFSLSEYFHKSTKSVVITSDLNVAEKILDYARRLGGESRLYVGIPAEDRNRILWLTEELERIIMARMIVER